LTTSRPWAAWYVWPTFGTPYAYTLAGQRTGAFTAQGHMSTETVQALEDAYESDTPIGFSLQIGEAGGATDGGLETGNCVITALTYEASADGEWDWTLDATTTGIITYTPASPASI
jgi:predicted secreted protein